MAEPPFPPLELANRVGSLEEADDPHAYYDWLGRKARDEILALLPDGWSFEGKRVLDFGCGAGRTLRHFLDEAAAGEVWGCDIDADSVSWIDENLSPPLHAFRNDETPPLGQASGSFDLIWSVSVFTHLVDHWAPWMLDLHRVLKDDGLLIATFMGEGMSEIIAGEPWEEDRVGMNVHRYGQSWDLGGPMVMHSPWWIRAHWGRAFEILDIVPRGFATDSDIGQGAVLMRKKNVALEPADLERPEPEEPRELVALRHEMRHARQEIGQLRGDLAWVQRRCHELDTAMAAAQQQLGAFRSSKSWRLTRPLRDLGNAVRRRRG